MKTTEVLEKYLKGRKLRPATIKNYVHAFKYLSEFSPEFPTAGGFINEWTLWLSQNKHLNDVSVKLHYNAVRLVARYMERLYDLPNPFIKSDVPKVTKKPRRYFSPSEIAHAITSCKYDEDRALILALVDSACRVQDLSNLYGKDIGINSFTTKTGKTGSHTYRLDPKLCIILKNLAGDDNNPVFKAKHRGDHRIFTNDPAPSSSLILRVRQILIDAGFSGPKLGAHTFRHSSASLVARSTKSPLAVKAILNQSDIKTSMGYIHDVEKMQQDTSPLKLVGEYLMNEQNNQNINQVKMLSDGNSLSSPIIEFNEQKPSETDSLLENSYREILDTYHCTTALNADDLKLIRRAFICNSQYGTIPSDGATSRALFARMLRKIHTPNKSS